MYKRKEEKTGRKKKPTTLVQSAKVLLGYVVPGRRGLVSDVSVDLFQDQAKLQVAWLQTDCRHVELGACTWIWLKASCKTGSDFWSDKLSNKVWLVDCVEVLLQWNLQEIKIDFSGKYRFLLLQCRMPLSTTKPSLI